MEISLFDFFDEEIFPHFCIFPVLGDTCMKFISASEYFYSHWLFIFVDDFEGQFWAEVEIYVIVMIEQGDTILVYEELRGYFIVYEIVFEKEVGIDGLGEIFFDVHCRVKYFYEGEWFVGNLAMGFGEGSYRWWN